MPQLTQEIISLLRRHGYSSTKQRLVVFSLLQGREPLSLVDLYTLAAGQLDRASLYRTINVFEEIGAVRRVNIGWKYKYELSDLFREHHHHLTCLGCQRVIALNASQLEKIVRILAAENKFQPVEHQIEIQGYCQQCQVAKK